ncbi:MAG: hypothetical protein EOR30_33150 [Mesorhizobium sp.]|uniref:hypothetical protein n=1 Tax=unclassified Mesorhizobium TaxID=325217 RepID=UPI000FCB079F|nr:MULTISPECIES: hypothetical protein [unclassified Mesorhizobium]RUV68971.1 hypothetical protein EOA78_25000 [Mesorhizobium sp. M5C.F.Cr.IN.023.01.1.1]RWF82717.1 MAG: hypothetical protein EOQ36_28645 [Mesorhizobium sp.]RWF92414.1 MAG: hypothetical protein EOQ45_21100 [Mesorhizobium sp.]RWI40296.1 MAG: hypothetical protein EOR14_13995 [Mesorhizobium sp.]RWI42804.1 MAG: hypothetical protein EOR15_31370 [Mesorhizobium sp.]
MTNVAVTQSAVDTSQVPARPNPPPPLDASAKQQLESAAVVFMKRLIEQHGHNADLALVQIQTSYAHTVDYFTMPCLSEPL